MMAGAPLRVLLIGPQVDRERLRELLPSEDWQFEEADSAEASRFRFQYEPEVVVLAGGSRNADRTDTCRRLRAEVAAETVPILAILPGDMSAELRGEVLQSGADAVLREPVEVHELRAQLRALVRGRRQDRAAVAELAQVFHAAVNGICQLDAHRRIQRTNEAFSEIFGAAAEALRERSIEDLIRAEHMVVQDLVLPTRGFGRRLPTFEVQRQGRRYHVFETPLLEGKHEHRGSVQVWADVTERKQSQEALRESEDRFRSVFEQSAVGMALVHPGGRWLRVNRRLCEILGYNERELLATTFQALTHPEDLQSDLDLVQQVLKGELRTFQLEKRYLHKQGHLVHANLNVSLVRNELGQPLHFISEIQDISERKRMENELRRSEEHFRRLIENAMDMIVLLDRTGVIHYASASHKQLGYAPNELQGTSLLDRVHADDKLPTLEAFERAFTHLGTPYRAEYRFRDKAGRWCTLESVGQAVVDESSRQTLIVNVRDISSRVRMEHELRRAHAFLDNIIDNIPFAVFVKDAVDDFRYLLWNKASEGMFGQPRARVLEHTDYDFVPRMLADRYRAVDRDVIARCGSVELADEPADGPRGEITLRTRKLALPDESGAARYVIGICEDITVRRRAAQELSRAKEAADAANRAKSEFLANMSHEIRTPMNGILGMTELALETDLTAEQREYLEMVKSSGETLLALINDILDFSKIEAGKLSMEIVPFELRDRLEEALRPLGVRAAHKGLALVHHVEPDVPDRLLGQWVQLQQILVNLVGNALKFTRHGEIAVRVAVEFLSDIDIQLHLSVADTGIGIPADKLETIFQPFVQADSSTTRRYGGTGLGLSICARLARLMGGRIWADSVLGQGSTFHCLARFRACPNPPSGVLPLPLNAAASSPSREFRVRPLRILLAEDNPVNRRMAVLVLEKQGHQVQVAVSGREALDALEEQAFDVFLTDVQMPEMDGFEVTPYSRSARTPSPRNWTELS